MFQDVPERYTSQSHMSYAVCKAQYLGGTAPATVIEYHQVHFHKVCCAGVGCSNDETQIGAF